jgi:hypothetical protein
MSNPDEIFQECRNEFDKLVSAANNIKSSNFLSRSSKIQIFFNQMDIFAKVVDRYLMDYTKGIDRQLVRSGDAFLNSFRSEPKNYFYDAREDFILSQARRLYRAIEDIHFTQNKSLQINYNECIECEKK